MEKERFEKGEKSEGRIDKEEIDNHSHHTAMNDLTTKTKASQRHPYNENRTKDLTTKNKTKNPCKNKSKSKTEKNRKQKQNNKTKLNKRNKTK